MKMKKNWRPSSLSLDPPLKLEQYHQFSQIDFAVTNEKEQTLD